MFKLKYGRGSDVLLTTQQVASSIYDNISVETGGFICGRMAYMSSYREAIPFSSEEELVEALNQYVKKHNIHTFDYSQVMIYYKAPGRKWIGPGETKITSTLFHIDFDIRNDTKSLDHRDLINEARPGDSNALKIFQKYHQNDKDEVTTQEPAKVFLVK